jgi:hypothetical protein
MLEHLANLGRAAAAVDAGHQVGQTPRIVDPAAGPALAEAAEIDQLHIEPADRRRLVEHLRLQRAAPSQVG